MTDQSPTDSILRTSSGAICYPIRDGKHLMVTSTTAHVVTLMNPERLEVVGLGLGPRDLTPAQLLTDIAIAGSTLADMKPRR